MQFASDDGSSFIGSASKLRALEMLELEKEKSIFEDQINQQKQEGENSPNLAKLPIGLEYIAKFG